MKQTYDKKVTKQMKHTYAKNVTTHDFKVEDNVMIWDPPQRKGLSRAFQPKWNGPWRITRFIGGTNCRLENECNGEKYVHLNLLKTVKARNPMYVETVKQTAVSPPCTGVNKMRLVDPNIFESVSEMLQDDHIPRYPIDINQWNINERRLLKEDY